jgi:hypothetical protein
MLELQLIYEGNGRFRTASRVDLTIASERFGAGEIIEASVGKRRSRKQHGWFFAMVGAAHENQSAGPLFDDAEQLRAWLLIKAGHCDVREFDPRAMTREVAAWVKQTFRAVDFTTDGRRIYAKTPRSIAFKAVGSAEMMEIANRVVDVICTDIVPGSSRADWEPFLREGSEKADRAAKRRRGHDRHDVCDARAGGQRCAPAADAADAAVAQSREPA